MIGSFPQKNLAAECVILYITSRVIDSELSFWVEGCTFVTCYRRTSVSSAVKMYVEKHLKMEYLLARWGTPDFPAHLAVSERKEELFPSLGETKNRNMILLVFVRAWTLSAVSQVRFVKSMYFRSLSILWTLLDFRSHRVCGAWFVQSSSEQTYVSRTHWGQKGGFQWKTETR